MIIVRKRRRYSRLLRNFDDLAASEHAAESEMQPRGMIGRVLEVDISERPGRITALEALAATILNTTEEQLKIEIEGM